LLYIVLVIQVVFPISARRLSNDGQLFLKKLPQKLFFVVSLAAGDGPDIGMQSMERNQFCTKNATTKIRKRHEA